MKSLKRILALALTLVLLFGIVSAAAAESATATTVRLAGTTGTVSVKNASGKDQSVKNDMRLYSGYTLATGKASAAYVSLDGTKAIKFDSSSKGSVKKSGNKLEVCLDDGKLFFNVTAPLAANESLNIRTSTMVTGIRGSYGWVTRTEVVLIHGHVTVTCINPVTGETRVTELYSGEKVYYDPASTVTGDPKLKEIDFIKEIITNDDFPAFVVDEMRKDVSLQTPVIEDVPSVDVPKLLGDYDQIKVAEDAATEAKEAELAEKRKEQTEFIENDPVDYLFDDEGDYETTTYSVISGGGDGMEFSIIDPTTDIAPGSNFRFHIEPGASYALYEEYLNVNAGGAAVTLTPNGTGYDASFTVNSDTNVTATGAVYQVTTMAAAEAAFNSGETYVELTLDDSGTIAYEIDAGKTLLVSANLNLPDYDNNGSIIINNTGSVSIIGGVTNGATGTIDIQGSLTVNAGGSLNNYGTITNKDQMTVNGTFNNFSGNTLINESGAVLTIAGTFNNGDDLTYSGRLVNEGTINVTDGIFTNYGTSTIESASGAVFNALYPSESTNAGNITNDGSMQWDTLTNNGEFTNNGKITSLTDFTNNGEFTNNGKITGMGATNTGTFTNKGNLEGTLTSTGTGNVDNYGYFKSGNLWNEATFNNNEGATLENTYTCDNRGTFNNAGLVETTSGSFANGATGYPGEFNNDGEIRMSSASSGLFANYEGNVNNNAGGSITGCGPINNYAVFINNGSINTKEFSNIGSGTLSGNDPVIIPIYYVYFDFNGKVPDNAYSASFAALYVPEGEYAQKPDEDPHDVDGYHFDGWYRESDCINEYDFEHTAVYETITLFAKWVAD